MDSFLFILSNKESSTYLGYLAWNGFYVRGNVANELRLEINLSGRRSILDSPTMNSFGLKTIYPAGSVFKLKTDTDLRIICYFIWWCNFEFVFELSMLLLSVKSIV